MNIPSLLIVISLLTNGYFTVAYSGSRLKVVNYAGAKMDFYWITGDHPWLKQSATQIRNGTSQMESLISYEGHEFAVRLLKKNELTGEEHHDAFFTKGDGDEDVVATYTAEKGLKLESRTTFSDLIDKTKSCSGLEGEEFDSCYSEIVSSDLTQIQEQLFILKEKRNLMAVRLRDYQCADHTLESTTPLKTLTFTHHDRNYTVDSLLEMSNAKIWTVKDFISQEECDILRAHGAPKLVSASVAGADGLPMISLSRKAQQAQYVEQANGDPLIPLKMKVIALTNLFTGFELHLPGQEDLTIIQYNVHDSYSPHCDGSCDGTVHNTGGRVASAVMYCHVAEKGGGTTFSKADVFVKPERGLATFFSYKGSDGIMDDGFTEHSGCPVLEGEKWLTTLWMREGVTAEKSWVGFDPMGIPTDYYEQTVTASG